MTMRIALVLAALALVVSACQVPLARPGAAPTATALSCPVTAPTPRGWSGAAAGRRGGSGRRLRA